MFFHEAAKGVLKRLPDSCLEAALTARRGFFYALGHRQKFGVMIETSNLCNAKCVFCSNPTLKRKKQVMNEDVFQKICTRLWEEHIPIREFVLHLNGEPLTDSHLVERVRFLKEKWPEAVVGFTTNFSLANQERVDELLSSPIDKITVSLNSLDAEEYEQNMGIAFTRTYENLNYFLKENKRRGGKIHVTVSCVLKSNNVEMYENICECFSSLADVRAIRLGKWIHHEDEFTKDLRPEVGDGRDCVICTQLYRTITFLSNGDYGLCCFDSEGSVHMNVMDVGIMEAMHSEVFKKLISYQLFYGRTNKECKGCSFI